MFGFLFWLFFIGIGVASLQDLKRREVDNWLNLFLVIASLVFIFYKAIFTGDVGIIFQTGFALVVLFALMNIFYYGRVFAGGDAKLLFVMAAFFIGVDFGVTLINIGVFVFFLMFAGSIYGLIYSFILYAKDFKKVNAAVKKDFDNLWVRYVVVFGIILFVLGYIDWIFFFCSVLLFLSIVLFVFTKGLEKVSMIGYVSGKALREGDWLVDDVRVKGKVIKADWDGLSLEDIELLKNRKKVKIKTGLPFVPAFFLAFLAYVFLRDWFFVFLAGLA